MKRKNIVLIFLAIIILSRCYNPEEDVTSIKSFEFNLLEPQKGIIANGLNTYNFVVKVPGIKYSASKEILVESTWGKWFNNSNSAVFSIRYNENKNMYIDTIQLIAGRTFGNFSIKVQEDSIHLETLKFEALPQYPSYVQMLSDSVHLKLLPSNTTKVKVLFFNEKGFPSYNTKFVFKTDAKVNIYPKEVYIDSIESTTTLQVSTDTKVGIIKLYGEISNTGMPQPTIDTLKILINK